MPDSYPFYTYSGLLTPDHYKKIGNAVWLFLWCISSTTAEKEKEGVIWGIVKGNQPQKYSDLSKIFGVTERTVSDWVKKLEQHGYLRVTRAPYGMIFTVKNSKRGYLKRPEENFHSLETDMKESSELKERYEENFHSGPEEIFRCNKDKSKRFTTTVDANKDSDPVDLIANRYSDLRTAQEGHPVYPTAKDYQAIAQIVAQGVPSSRTIELLERRFREFEEQNPGKKIKSFSYLTEYILEHYQALQARDEAKKLAKRRIPESGKNHKPNNRGAATKTTQKPDSITGGQVGWIGRKKVSVPEVPGPDGIY